MTSEFRNEDVCSSLHILLSEPLQLIQRALLLSSHPKYIELATRP